MSIIKLAKRTRYTVINNTLIEDNRLDYDHVGLLTYLLSKRSNWNVSIAHLSKQKKSGTSKIKRLLKELQGFGYAKYQRLSTGKTEWTIYENPQVENHQVENPQVEKPHVEKPHVEKPQVANQRLVITDKESNYYNNSKKEKNKKENQNYPDNLNIEAWRLWEQHKKERNQSYKPTGAMQAMKKLSMIDFDNQMNCIESAVSNNYSGFFIKNFTGVQNANTKRKLTPAEQSEQRDKWYSDKYANEMA